MLGGGLGVYVNGGIERSGFGLGRRLAGSAQNVEIRRESQARSTFWALYDQNVEPSRRARRISTFWAFEHTRTLALNARR